MRRSFLVLALSSIAGLPSLLVGQEIIPDVEYFSGKTGLEEKRKGVLVVGREALTFQEKNGTPIFAIPLRTITQAERATDIRDASVGKKLLFGSLAGSRKQEFITIPTETDSSAEAVVFKLKQNTGAGALAKINYQRKKAGAVVETDSSPPAVTESNPQPPR
jgi:hypothetical protein